ncbi:monooxygenase [Punctularia strigosozonata HHB-11173 SS5]|uniref:monooxygenase n=1 Tax=Punctularia strigosozonata (strain HHB-11173) TaxID=741275 RepID=UPI000441644F|nr:monooxygenase [Punctularia strigosozonata HHB-11173 SS5]EIN05357.1 monooxygenase [Punctularia strigosozonata HHB-11173 SS5]
MTTEQHALPPLSPAPPTPAPDVLIAGAGPAGLVLALSLLKHGLSVRLIDKDPTHHVGQRGAGVMPRSLELYNTLGVLPDILAASHPPLPMQAFTMPGGREPLRQWEMSPREHPTPGTPWPNAVMIGQDKTEAILRAHLAQLGCRVELNTRLASFAQDDDAVRATLAKTGADGTHTEEVVRVPWLVGADGARSTVRKALNLSFLGETRQERYAIADVHVQGLDMHHIHVFGGGPPGTILIWPSERKDGDLMTVYVAGPDADYERLASSPDFFRDHVKAKLGRDDVSLGAVTWLTDYRPNVRMVDTFQSGRVFLVGDAAHAHSLMGGQGLNTSIQDASNLGWKLALVARRAAPRALLASYTSERLPVVAAVLDLTSALQDKLSSAKGEDAGAWKRGDGLGQLGVNYRWSPWVFDERLPEGAEEEEGAEGDDKGKGERNPYGRAGDEGAQMLRAGDRAPDAPALVPASGADTAPTRLFDLLSPTAHTVLLFLAGSTDARAEAVRKHRVLARPGVAVAVYEILPPSPSPSPLPFLLLPFLPFLPLLVGHAYANYGVDKDAFGAVVVRPDGYVGAVATSVAGLQRYFDKLIEVPEGYTGFTVSD